MNIVGSVYKVPNADKQQQVCARYNVCLHFVSLTLAVVCDGTGKLHIVETGDRTASQTASWKVHLINIQKEGSIC